MADDAELRIFLIDGGDPGAGGAGPAAGYGVPAGTPTPPADAVRSAADQAKSMPRLPSPEPPGAAFLQQIGMGGAVRPLAAAESLMGGADAAGLGAAGPIGAAAVIVQAGASMMAGAFRGAAQAVGQFGDAMARGIGGSNMVAALDQLREGASGSAKALLDSIPVVGGLMKAQMEFGESLANLPRKLSDAFVERGRQLEGLSGPIAGARAGADVRSLLRDLQEAGELGEGIGRLTTAQSRWNDELRAILLPIKRVLVEVLARQAERGVAVLEMIGPHIEAQVKLLEAVAKAASTFNWANADKVGRQLGVDVREAVDILVWWRRRQQADDKKALEGLYNVFEGKGL